MRIVTATDMKGRLGEYIEECKSNPVFIERYARPCAVLLSHERYQELLAAEERLADLVDVKQGSVSNR